MKPSESCRIPMIPHWYRSFDDDWAEYQINPAILLSEWIVESEAERCAVLPFFTPSGRLMLEKESEHSYRATDLFTGNTISIDCPEIGDGYAYLPLTERDGILHGDQNMSRDNERFMRATLDLAERRIVVHFETMEEVPANAEGDQNATDYTRFGDDVFGFTIDGDESGERFIFIRKLGAETDGEKWIRIDDTPFHYECYPITMGLHNNILYCFTCDVNDHMMSYSLEKKKWEVVYVDFVSDVHYDDMHNSMWFDGVIISHYGNSSHLWSFLVVDPLTEQLYELHADYPKEWPWRLWRAHAGASDFGIVGVMLNYDEEQKLYRYQSHLINFRRPLPLALSAHFKLQNSERGYANLPAIDPIPPLFGVNSYRYSEETEKRREAAKKRDAKLRKLKLSNHRIHWIMRRSGLDGVYPDKYLEYNNSPFYMQVDERSAEITETVREDSTEIADMETPRLETESPSEFGSEAKRSRQSI